MSAPTAKRQRSDAARNAELIASTAREVIARRGRAASLEEIAKEAGLGIATLYRHYPERSSLVCASLQLALGESLTEIRSRGDGQFDPWDAFLVSVEAVMVFADKERSLLMAAHDSGVVATAFSEVVLEDLEDLLETAVSYGRIRSDVVKEDGRRVLVMLLSVLTTTEPETGGWRRYLALLADALTAQPTSSLTDSSRWELLPRS